MSNPSCLYIHVVFSLLALIGFISMTFLEEDRVRSIARMNDVKEDRQTLDGSSRGIEGGSMERLDALGNRVLLRLDDPSHDYYYMPTKRRSKRSFDEQDDDGYDDGYDDDGMVTGGRFMEAPTLFKLSLWNNHS